ncbi:MAG: glycosyltransferase family 2 protein [Proteobacteria bacterium]|nr:glycosyltransferase family 2 protein [Pseudomonadota bacterium]
MTRASATHLVLIPSYNSGRLLAETLRAARSAWGPVWTVIDGSTDRSAEQARAMAQADPLLRVFVLPRNRGKGAAILHGLIAARDAGFTHALTMDADAQHPADAIAGFMAASMAAPEAMILGLPVFDATAPAIRVHGRKLSNWWTDLETLGAGIGDSLCGFRVYPIAPLIAAMAETRFARRFDFDAEAAVRLCWRGVPPVRLPVKVRYLSPAEGGVSHFRYIRDNVLLTFMHVRLVFGCLWRLPALLRRRDRAGGGWQARTKP